MPVVSIPKVAKERSLETLLPADGWTRNYEILFRGPSPLADVDRITIS
jgi:hypothetical protein